MEVASRQQNSRRLFKNRMIIVDGPETYAATINGASCCFTLMICCHCVLFWLFCTPRNCETFVVMSLAQIMQKHSLVWPVQETTNCHVQSYSCPEYHHPARCHFARNVYKHMVQMATSEQFVTFGQTDTRGGGFLLQNQHFVLSSTGSREVAFRRATKP